MNVFGFGRRRERAMMSVIADLINDSIADIREEFQRDLDDLQLDINAGLQSCDEAVRSAYTQYDEIEAGLYAVEDRVTAVETWQTNFETELDSAFSWVEEGSTEPSPSTRLHESPNPDPGSDPVVNENVEWQLGALDNLRTNLHQMVTLSNSGVKGENGNDLFYVNLSFKGQTFYCVRKPLPLNEAEWYADQVRSMFRRAETAVDIQVPEMTN